MAKLMTRKEYDDANTLFGAERIQTMPHSVDSCNVYFPHIDQDFKITIIRELRKLEDQGKNFNP